MFGARLEYSSWYMTVRRMPPHRREPPVPVLVVAVALFGLAIGSFLNVIIYRLPQHLSLSAPASHCPNCGKAIRMRHNVPVLGWLVLRGKCADCSSSISSRYPLVELITGVGFIAVTLRLNQLDLLPATPAYLYFVAVAITLTMIDIDVHRLPDAIVLPSYVVLALGLTFAALISDHPSSLLRATIGGFGLYLFYWLMRLAYPKGMGGGDVKLAGLLGAMLAYLSYSSLLIGAFLAFVLGGIWSVALLASGKASRKSRIPFGPFMLAAAFISLFASTQVAGWYSNLVLKT
jgi:leader peptidase (prepilin peptidase)/N-methyltransferase